MSEAPKSILGYWNDNLEVGMFHKAGGEIPPLYEEYTRTDLIQPMIDAAEQRGYANAMEAERKLFDADLSEMKAEMKAERDAAVAAAYQDAAAKAYECWMDGVPTPEIEKHIMTLIPADAAAALAERDRKARIAGMKAAMDALDKLPEYGSPDVNIGVSNAWSAIRALIAQEARP